METRGTAFGGGHNASRRDIHTTGPGQQNLTGQEVFESFVRAAAMR